MYKFAAKFACLFFEERELLSAFRAVSLFKFCCKIYLINIYKIKSLRKTALEDEKMLLRGISENSLDKLLSYRLKKENQLLK